MSGEKLVERGDSTQLIAGLRTHAYDDCGGIELPTHICNVAATLIRSLQATLDSLAEREVWRDIATAPKDRTPILALMRSDLYPGLRPGRKDLDAWNGLTMVVRHNGVADDGFDIGWQMAAPVGQGGFPDEWFAGWKPLPDPPARQEGGA